MRFESLRNDAHRFLRDQAGNEVLVVAMERAAADDVVRSLGGSHLGIHRFSLRQLISTLSADVLADLGSRPLTVLSSQALAAHIIDKSELTYYAPISRTPGFAAALVETVTRIRLNSQQPPGGDLSRLTSAYERALVENALSDSAMQVKAAIEGVQFGKNHLVGQPVLLLDVRPASVLEQQFIRELTRRAAVTESLTADGTNGQSKTALEAIQQQLFAETMTVPVSPEGVEFLSAAGESLECLEIARRIFESGIPLDQCAILLRHPARYQALVEDALRRAGIPAWFTHGVVRPESSGRSFLALLHCAEESLTASRFAEYLSHEQKEQPYGWERLLVDAAVIGGADRWEHRLSGLEQEFRDRIAGDGDESLKKQIQNQLERLGRLREFALPIIKQLDALRSPRIWGEWLDALRDLAEQALDDAEGVLGLLDELEPMSTIGPVSLEEVLRVFSLHLGNVRRPPKGNRFGRIFVGAIEDARALSFKLVCVPGLSEGSFPKPIFDDPLLPGNSGDLELQERLLLRQAVAAATERVILSWPRIELATGRLRVPSFYVLEAARAAFGKAIDRRAIEREAERSVDTSIGWPATADPNRAVDAAEFDLARLRPALTGKGSPGLAAYLKEANPIVYRSLQMRWRRWSQAWSIADGLVVSAETAADALAKYRPGERSYSPSTLQLFAQCPYRFGLRAVIGLYPLERATRLHRMDPLTRGLLFHEVQKRLLQAIGSYPIDTASMAHATEVLDQKLQEVADEYQERLCPAIPQIWISEIQRLRADLRGCLLTLAREHSDWVPSDLEKQFSDVNLIDNWKLRGRIDVAEQNGKSHVRIVDYKTGVCPTPAPLFTGGGEVLQPLLYALAAERLYPDKITVGGQLFYATMRGGYRMVDIALNEDSRTEATHVLSTIENAIHRGYLPAAPREDACKSCDYLSVCGPNEEERLKRKRQRDLEPLRDLRGVQ